LNKLFNKMESTLWSYRLSWLTFSLPKKKNFPKNFHVRFHWYNSNQAPTRTLFVLPSPSPQTSNILGNSQDVWVPPQGSFLISDRQSYSHHLRRICCDEASPAVPGIQPQQHKSSDENFPEKFKSENFLESFSFFYKDSWYGLLIHFLYCYNYVDIYLTFHSDWQMN
jgi:hypothetical protein